MSKARVTAPANPRDAALARIDALRRKPNRTPAEVAEMLNLLADRVAALEEQR